MSELISAAAQSAPIRWNLLATVSALSLFAVLGSTPSSAAEDADQPTVWIDLGGQLEQMGKTQNVFSAPFLTQSPVPDPYKPESPLDAEKAPNFSYGGEAKLSIAPKGTDWVFSAGLRYGRSSNDKHVHKQTYHQGLIKGLGQSHYNPSATASKFADTKAEHEESHTIVDFMAGRDVGLGLFGAHSHTTLSFGVRYAQFTESSSIAIHARPDQKTVNRFPPFFPPSFYAPTANFHVYSLNGSSNRSFHGIGPSLSLNGSAPVIRGAEAEIAFDWGVNAAVLFGRQKASVAHETSGQYFLGSYPAVPGVYTRGYNNLYNRGPLPAHRSRSVVVPNLGGFAGLSFRYSNAKVKFGYRADYFFGATDGGIDNRQSLNRGFFGPFAGISIGLGG